MRGDKFQTCYMRHDMSKATRVSSELYAIHPSYLILLDQAIG